jgi:cytochrome P450
MEAGSDTTASTILSFILALTNRPAVLKKCQEEMDSIVGIDRTPDEGDLPKLRYMKAAMQEVCFRHKG